MMKFLLPALIALSAAVTALPASAATVTPVSVTASNTFPFFGEYKPSNLIDGSGLSGGLHNDNYAAMWMTDQSVQSATLLFDLGGAYDLTGVNIWNYNFGDPGFLSLLERGAKDFAVLLSDDGVNFTNVLSDTLAMGTGDALASQDFALSGTARFVRLDLLNNHASGDYIPYTATGLSEVRFEGSLAAVPEPATWAMMIGGFGLVGGALRRRNAATPALA